MLQLRLQVSWLPPLPSRCLVSLRHAYQTVQAESDSPHLWPASHSKLCAGPRPWPCYRRGQLLHESMCRGLSMMSRRRGRRTNQGVLTPRPCPGGTGRFASGILPSCCCHSEEDSRHAQLQRHAGPVEHVPRGRGLDQSS